MEKIEEKRKIVKLYDVPGNTRIKLIGDIKVPIGALPLKEGDIVDFKNIDGMYSLCYKDGERCYLAGWTEVEIIKLTIIK